MEKTAPPPPSAAAFTTWVNALEQFYDKVVELENLGIAIPAEMLALIQYETEPAFRRINGFHARATATLPLAD